MKSTEINIRDPFVLCENGTYYMYGTRGKGFGIRTKGFDVFTSTDLENWSDPICVFDSEANGYNKEVNWAPEVHAFRGAYYLFATFTKENGLRGTYILKSDSPKGPFVPHSKGAATPYEWECLDGTLYVDDAGTPYLVFCHEHTQIIDGTICYARLTDDLTALAEEPTVLFAASEVPWISPLAENGHYVTDGPFLFRTKTGELLMIWSSFIKGAYAECVVRFADGKLSKNLEHIQPLLDNDGGHGMIFNTDRGLFLTVHTPNKTTLERPVFLPLKDLGDRLELR